MAYNTVYVWSAYETLGSTNLNANMANLDYLKTKADRAILSAKVFFPSQTIVSGDAAYGFAIPYWLNGYNLTGITGFIWTTSSSGDVVVQLRNQTPSAVDMLTDPLTIDQGEYNSNDSASPVVIDTNNDDVAAFDNLYIDVDNAGTGAAGLQVDLLFYLT